MPGPTLALNRGYIDDARWVKQHGFHVTLIALIEIALGDDFQSRQSQHRKIGPFAREFGVGFARDETPAIQISRFYTNIKNARLTTWIAAVLAWLCVDHVEVAQEFYDQTGLWVLLDSKYRKFVGPTPVESPFPELPKPKLLQSKESEPLRYLYYMESELNNIGYGEHGQAEAAEALFRKRNEAVEMLRDLALNADERRLAEFLSKIYELGHWADARSHRSHMAYNDVADIVMAKLSGSREPFVARLMINVAINQRMMGSFDREKRTLKLIPPLGELRRVPAAAELLVLRADYALRADAGITADACQHHIEEFGKTSKDAASWWRCRACLAFRKNTPTDDEFAFSAIAQARAMLKDATIELKTEDAMIAHYLEALDLLIRRRQNRLPVAEFINAAYRLISRIDGTDRRAMPLIAGIYEACAQGLDEMHKQQSRRNFQLEAVINRQEAKLALSNSVSDFCFFDIPAIARRLEQSLADRLKNY